MDIADVLEGGREEDEEAFCRFSSLTELLDILGSEQGLDDVDGLRRVEL